MARFCRFCANGAPMPRKGKKPCANKAFSLGHWLSSAHAFTGFSLAQVKKCLCCSHFRWRIIGARPFFAPTARQWILVIGAAAPRAHLSCTFTTAGCRRSLRSRGRSPSWNGRRLCLSWKFRYDLRSWSVRAARRVSLPRDAGIDAILHASDVRHEWFREVRIPLLPAVVQVGARAHASAAPSTSLCGMVTSRGLLSLGQLFAVGCAACARYRVIPIVMYRALCLAAWRR